MSEFPLYLNESVSPHLTLAIEYASQLEQQKEQLSALRAENERLQSEIARLSSPPENPRKMRVTPSQLEAIESEWPAESDRYPDGDWDVTDPCDAVAALLDAVAERDEALECSERERETLRGECNRINFLALEQREKLALTEAARDALRERFESVCAQATAKDSRIQELESRLASHDACLAQVAALAASQHAAGSCMETYPMSQETIDLLSAEGRALVVWQHGFPSIVYYPREGRDWCRTKEEAQAVAERMRQKRIASLRRSIAKLEKMRF